MRWSQRLGQLPALAAAVLALFCTGAGAAPSPVAPGAPILPGTARVWFYRVFFPDDTFGMPAVAMNGRIVGYARSGYSFYRDVPAGAYHVTVDSYLIDPSQAKDVVLAPGTQIYLAIESDPTSIENLRGYRRGTYYVGIEPAQIAAIHLGQASFSSGY
jgi:hypothetical protein